MSDELAVIAELKIRIHANGALSVEGPVADTRWCLAALENAKDAIRNNARRKDELVVPAKDVAVPRLA